MEITHALGNIPLKEIEHGTVFRIGTDYYMKVTGNITAEPGIVMTVNLDYGGLVRFKEEITVTPVECELFVKS